MGCYPLGKMVAKALRKYKGRRRHLSERTYYYPSSPPSYTYARSVATLSTEIPGMIVPPEVTQCPTISKHHPEAVITPSPHAENAQPKEQTRVRFAPGPDPNSEPSRPHPIRHEHAKVKFATEPEPQNVAPPPSRKGSGRVRFAAEPDPHETIQNHPNRKEQGHTRYGPSTPNWHESGSNYRYIMSPLPRWDDRERRQPQEYFSGEYHYYPTPVREGIYRIATDANRLTTIFSEENPNACSIV